MFREPLAAQTVEGRGSWREADQALDDRIERRPRDAARTAKPLRASSDDSRRRLVAGAGSVRARQRPEGQLHAQVHSGRQARRENAGVVRPRVRRRPRHRGRLHIQGLGPRFSVPQGRRHVPGARPRRRRAVRLSAGLDPGERCHGGNRVPQRRHARSCHRGKRRRPARRRTRLPIFRISRRRICASRLRRAASCRTAWSSWRAVRSAPALGETFARLSGRGPIDAAVDLDLPIRNLDKRKIEVQARFADATVAMRDVDAPVRSLQGNLTVRNTLVAAADLHGQWLGGPLDVVIRPRTAQRRPR